MKQTTKMQKFEEWFDKLCDFCAWLAAGIVVVVMLVITAEVVMRLAFSTSISWALQFTEYSMVYMVFLGTAWVQREGAHVAVDLLTSMLPHSMAGPLGRAMAAVGAFAFAILTYYAAKLSITQYINGALSADFIAVPEYLVTMVIPFGSALMTLEFLRQAWKRG